MATGNGFNVFDPSTWALRRRPGATAAAAAPPAPRAAGDDTDPAPRPAADPAEPDKGEEQMGDDGEPCPDCGMSPCECDTARAETGAEDAPEENDGADAAAGGDAEDDDQTTPPAEAAADPSDTEDDPDEERPMATGPKTTTAPATPAAPAAAAPAAPAAPRAAQPAARAPATVAELREAFPGDENAGFREGCLEKGLTVLEAKALRWDEQVRSGEARQRVEAALGSAGKGARAAGFDTKEGQGGPAGGSANRKPGQVIPRVAGGGPAPLAGARTYMEAVQYYRDAGETEGTAYMLAKRYHPQLHAAWKVEQAEALKAQRAETQKRIEAIQGAG